MGVAILRVRARIKLHSAYLSRVIVADNAIGLGALGVLTVCCRESLCLGGTNIVMGTSPTSGSGVPLDLRIAGWGNLPC